MRGFGVKLKMTLSLYISSIVKQYKFFNYIPFNLIENYKVYNNKNLSMNFLFRVNNEIFNNYFNNYYLSDFLTQLSNVFFNFNKQFSNKYEKK